MTSPPHAAPQEPDRIPGRPAARIIVVGVAVLGFAVAWSTWLLHRRVAELGRAPASPRALSVTTERVNGRLERTLIERTAVGWDRRAAQTRELESYSWVDRDHGIAHIPIERAMEIIAAKEHAP